MIDPIVTGRRDRRSGMGSTPAQAAEGEGDVFVGGMRRGEIPGTGHPRADPLQRKMEELRRETLPRGPAQRIRDVRQGPDELLCIDDEPTARCSGSSRD